MGSKFNNSYVGNSSSDAIIFSLHPVKSITSGEGGLMLTNSSKIFKKAKLLRSHGLVRYKKKHWKSNMIELGYNYKITEFQCALGLSQLKKLKNFITKRNQIAKYYKSKLRIQELFSKNITITNIYIATTILLLNSKKNFKIKNEFFN